MFARTPLPASGGLIRGFVLVLGLCTTPLFAQEPPCCNNPWPAPAGHILVDDMWLPAEAVHGEGTYTGSVWPSGAVAFYFDPVITSSERTAYRTALRDLEAVSGLNFFEYSSPPGIDYIHVVRSTDSGVSSSAVGRQGGQQFLRIWSSHWDSKIILMHETMHALGFKHEQSRPDRDTYVTINWFNIPNDRQHNFTLDSGASALGSYDFLSIMHYRPFAFAINENIPTIVCKPAYSQFQDQMGNRAFVSQGDCNALQFIYGQPSAPTTTTCSPSSVLAGSGSVIITVTGTNFYEGPIVNAEEPGSVITINGAELPTTYINHTTLQATIPASTIANAGGYTIRVKNHAEAGGTSTTAETFIAVCGSVSAKIGQSVSGIGDVNGDGKDDYLVGSPGETTQTGRVRCFSGATGAQIWSVIGTSTNTGLGQSLSDLGDINGDGRHDFVVGLPFTNSTNGKFEIRSGSNGAILAAVFGSFTDAYFGERVQHVGDVDGDGDVEFLVAAPGYNSSRGRVELWSVNGGLIRFHEGTLNFEGMGFGLAGGFDMTGDGVPDYALGSPFYGGLGINQGRIRIYNGATGSVVATRDGDGEYDHFGFAMAMMPSTSGVSGNAHLVVGAPEPGGNLGQSMGAGYVRIFTGASGVLPTFSYNTLATHLGATTGDCFGYSVAFGGDANDDGRSDVLIGSPQYPNGAGGPTGHGFAELRSGVDWAELARELHFYVFNAPAPGGRLGHSVALIGDRDGDTRLDYVTGEPSTDVPCLGTGSFQTFTAAVPPALGRVLITEVSSGNPDGAEICNFGTAAINLSGWTMQWRDGASLWTSTPLNITLQPNEIAVILETAGVAAEVPPGIQVANRFPSIGTTTGDYVVSLRTPSGHVVDEVRVAGSNGDQNEPGLGGKFRGYARNEQALMPGQFAATIHPERAWDGLDSNSGGDWYQSYVRSFGLENRCSGLRGYDPIVIPRVKLNEIDTSPDFVELYNASGATQSMANWYLLASSNQGVPHTVVRPPWSIFGISLVFTAGQYMVLGDTATEPTELPASGVSYYNVGSPGFPWVSEEFDCGLYDSYGRLVDYVRATRAGAEVVHNHPRAPSSPLDFKGAGIQGDTGDAATGRNALATDNNSGQDWRAVSTRTMGSSNSAIFQIPWFPSTAPQLDVRLNSTRTGGGLTMIINGGSAHAGRMWTFAFSGGHLNGTGPILGLGPDAVNNWLVTSVTPPWFGVLDADGSARLDVPGGSVPPGLQTDDIFLLQDATLNFVHWTKVLQFDS